MKVKDLILNLLLDKHQGFCLNIFIDQSKLVNP